jgi:Type II secretory pathway, component PulF
MIKAGEEGGSLAETLQILATQMERSSTLRKKVKGAMIYPAIVITIMIGIGFLMMIFVMPSITDTFTKLNVDLPPMTVALIAVSDFVNGNLLLVLGIMLSSLIALVYFMRTDLGKTVFHYLYIKAPIIGIITRETNAARTARTLSSLLSSGVDVLRALSITEEVIQNKYYKKVVKDAALQVENGKPLSGAFIERSDLYPVLVGEMIAVGEETGQISKMMSELAVFYENEVENRTDNLSTIIEPLLMVVIGGGVGVFALAMIAPIYSVGEGL